MASSFPPLPDTLITDTLIKSFPNPSLPSIRGKSTYPQLAELLRTIKANAASIHSNHRRGANRHLGIVVSTVIYATIAPNSPFIIPINHQPLT
jgi:hypothetical protein